MNRKTSGAILLTLLALSICFLAAADSSSAASTFGLPPPASNLGRLAATVPIVVGAGLHGNGALNQPTRIEIYDYVRANPGVHFRGICDGLGLSVGVVQYHLDLLEHAGLISSYIDGANKRYFEAGAYSQADMKLISISRHQTTAEILNILVHGSAVHRDIAQALGISSQALTWQMNQLRAAGLISAEKVGVNVNYCLKDAAAVGRALDLTKN